MNVLEKILEEIKIEYNVLFRHANKDYFNGIADMYIGTEEIIRSHMDEVPKCGECSRRKWYQKGYNDSKGINVRNNDELIDRKELKEEIENLRMTITGMRIGKTMTAKALEEYKKSILRIIDAQQTVNNDGWIPVEKKLPEVQEGLEDMYCPEFNVTIKWATETTTLKYSWDGTWFDNNGYVYNVIAWKPLPEAYRRHSKSFPQDAKRHIMDRFTKER